MLKKLKRLAIWLRKVTRECERDFLSTILVLQYINLTNSVSFVFCACALLLFQKQSHGALFTQKAAKAQTKKFRESQQQKNEARRQHRQVAPQRAAPRRDRRRPRASKTTRSCRVHDQQRSKEESPLRRRLCHEPDAIHDRRTRSRIRLPSRHSRRRPHQPQRRRTRLRFTPVARFLQRDARSIPLRDEADERARPQSHHRDDGRVAVAQVHRL